MSVHIHDVLDYLDIHPVNQHGDDVFSFMDLVFHAYSMYNTMDSAALREMRKNLCAILAKLPDEDSEFLFDRIGEFCMEKERIAFAHGIVVGIYLMSEIKMLP